MKSLFKILSFILYVILLTACSSGSSSSSSSQISYTTLNYTGSLPAGGFTGLTGIRGIPNSDNVYITGSYVVSGMSNGTLYVGPILGGGTYYVYNYPSESGAEVSGTNVYSAESGIGSNVQLTGTYTTVESGESHAFSFYYNGPVTNDNQESSLWTTLVFPSSLVPDNLEVKNTYAHSIMGLLVVGNYETPVTASNGFIYNTLTQTYESMTYPGSRYTSAYGVWWNSGESYTITGGYSNESDGILSYGYIVDYNITTHELTNWESYTFNNNQTSTITHFEGITTDNNGGYNLAASGAISDTPVAGFVNVGRTSSGGFGTATWITVAYPNSQTTTADTVYQNYLLGVYTMPNESGLNGYAATIPTNWY